MNKPLIPAHYFSIVHTSNDWLVVREARFCHGGQAEGVAYETAPKPSAVVPSIDHVHIKLI